MVKFRIARRLAVLATIVLGLAWAPAASASVTPDEAARAAERGAAWFADTQADDGALAAPYGGGDRFGEWTLTALAAGGYNAADVRANLMSSTAQSFYDDLWAVSGPGAIACPAGGGGPEVCDRQPDGLPTDSARTVLSAIAGGLQPSRIAAGRDYVSRLAFWWSGDQIGYRGLLNDDIFGILALDHAGAPLELLATLAEKVRAEQLPDGGWHWRSSTGGDPLPASVSADTDMTAAAVGALCAAGASPTEDPAVRRGLDLIKDRQAGGSGGFSTGLSATGTNTNTTAWVASGLTRCGLDPQGPEWTTADGRTPFDFLLAMQNDDGSFRYMPANSPGSANLMASYQAVSPLGGNDWSGEAPARASSSLPRVKPAPAVAEGTVVPFTLVVDHGDALPTAERSRMCRVEAPEGTDLADALERAERSAEPGGCISGAEVTRDEDGIAVAALNGVAGGWTVELNGGGEARALDQTVGLGDMLVLRYHGTDRAEPPAIVPVPQIEVGSGPGHGPGPGGDPDPGTDPAPGGGTLDPIARSYPRARIVGKPRLRRGRVIARVRCPAAARPTGCAVTATFSARTRGGKRFRAFAATGVEIKAGRTRAVAVRSARLKRRVSRSNRGLRRIARAIPVRVVVGTRSPDGAIRYARARGRVRGL